MSVDKHRAAAGRGPVTVALVTVSDTRTPETDENGIYLREQFASRGHMVAGYRIVRDEPDQVEAVLDEMVSLPGVQLVLFNGGTGTFELEGVRFITGIRFDFTGSAVSQLPAGAYVLVVKSRAAFEQRYGPGFPIAGEYAGQLDNAGERVVLVGAQNETLLDFTYGTWPPWPMVADGDGPSLEVLDPEGGLSLPGTWQASAVAGGSPGMANALPPLALQVISLEGAQLRVRFEGRAGLGYTVYYRDSVSAGAWQVLERGEPLAQSQSVEASLDFSANVATRFFQVSIP